MHSTFIAALLISTLTSVTDDPPPPDPDNPVDYLAWINAKYDRHDAANAAEQYDAAAEAYADDEQARKILSAPRGAEWTKQDRDAIQTWIATNEECLNGITILLGPFRSPWITSRG